MRRLAAALALLALACSPGAAQNYGKGNAVELQGYPVKKALAPISACVVTWVAADSQFECAAVTVSPSSLPNPTATTLGGVESIAAVSHNFLTSISTAGAPAFVKMQAGIDAGSLHNLSIAPDAAAAAAKISSLRESGTKVQDYLNQGALFDSDLTDEGRNLVKAFSTYGRSAKKIGDVLSAYSDAVNAVGSPKQESFFSQIKPTKGELLEAALRKVHSSDPSNAAAKPSLFDEAPAEPAAAAAPAAVRESASASGANDRKGDAETAGAAGGSVERPDVQDRAVSGAGRPTGAEVEPKPPAILAGAKPRIAPKAPTGSTTMGSGLGALDPFLREAFGEMKDLKDKRDAALKELERAKATPGEQKFGQKVIEHFTAERDLWGARVNQAIEKLRRLVPAAKDQEALSLMREFRDKPGELQQWLAGTHPSQQAMSLGSTQRARVHIEQMRPAIESALQPSAAMQRADAVLTKIARQTLAEGQKIGFLESRWTPEQYTPHILHPKNEGDVAQPIGDKVGRALGGKVGKYFAFAQTRDYPTLLDAVADGVWPKTINAFDAFTIHGDKFATARATRLLVNQIKDSGVGIEEKDRWKRPKGWVALASHSPEFQSEQHYQDPGGEDHAVQVPLVVPKYIDDALRPITHPEFLGALPGFRKLRFFQAYTKSIQLGLSLFHAYTENLMALGNMGPMGWARGLRADRTSPEFTEQERDFIAHGGTTSVQGKTVEAYKSLQPGSIPTWNDIWQRAPVVREMDQLARSVTEFTFGRLQRQFKVTDYALHKAAWLAKNPNVWDRESALQSIAKEINAVYGGLHWENIGVSKATVELARALMLAPDWTISNLFNLKYAAERGTPAGKMARAFWIRTLVGGAIATQLLSLALSKKPSKNPTQVYMGQDPDGKDVYQNVFFKGASGDVINLVHNVGDYGAVEGLARTLAGKAAPVVRTGLQLASNRDYLGREIVPKGMHPVAGTVRAAGAIAKGVAPVPFSAQNMYDMLLGPDAGKYRAAEVVLAAALRRET